MKTIETAGRGRGNRFARSTLSAAIASGLALAAVLPASAQSYQDPGRLGDPASWRTAEFQADWGLAAIGAEYAYARGLTGRGVRLGVYDTGVALQHGEFAGRNHGAISIGMAGCQNTTIVRGPGNCFFTDGRVSEIDAYYLGRTIPSNLSFGGTGARLILQYNAHGTHVAGTMAANRNGTGMHGVAFGADLTSARLFFNRVVEYYVDGSGRIVTRTNTTGPDTATTVSMFNQLGAAGVRAINHSWGLSSEPTTRTALDAIYRNTANADYLRTAFVNPTLRYQTIQVWAAGNNSGNIAGIYATLPRLAPEVEPYWLSVVNLAQNGSLSASSSICGFSANWCITAPGTGIASSVVTGTITGRVIEGADGSMRLLIDSERPEYGYANYTGTSMAAPHVTGALGLLMERFPYLNNAQVRDVLLTTARDLGAPGVDPIYGWGLMDLRRAIEGPGQIRVDTNVVMNQRAGGAQTWDGAAWDNWTNNIGGPGRLTKSGIGWLRLSGTNSFNGLTVNDGVLELSGTNRLGSTIINGGWGLVSRTGVLANAVTVNSGTFVVNGVQSGGLLTVNRGGALAGTGTVGTTVVNGTVAPGNSIGTLTVNGNYTQQVGSIFEAEVNGLGASDRINVTGRANLLGGTVRVLAGPNDYLLGQRYTLLTAAGGVAGAFQAVDSSAFSPFLRFSLGYAPNSVAMDVSRGRALATAAGTQNQSAVAAAADALPMTHVLAQRLTQLFPAQAPAAFDALSGEVHSSTSAILVDEARHVREAALARAMPLRSPSGDDSGITAWAQVTGGGDALRSDGNAARADSQSSSLLVGVDHAAAGGWRFGALAGSGRSDLQVEDRASRSNVDSRHFGVYAGNAWGAFQMRAGATYARHDVDTERTVAFPGFQDRNRARYDASSVQAFVEGGYRVERSDWAVEPFLQLASVAVDSDRFVETGGAAALSGQTEETRAGLATVGMRFERGLKAAGQDASWLFVRGGIGWRHASGDLNAATTAAWSGGSAFTVEGAGIAESAAVANLGLGAWVTESSLLELGYSGQFDDEARNHGVNLRYSVGF
ncbi:autotransporter domain-containing protein [Lysobacter korlensis]|uniref:Autotransporter domain-containing protein n=1 Tax=Lysobacter korlensis TaxID=553636 RepID=A0ABV6RQC5_9GAMM